jgi:hypothetical protein
MYYGINYIRRRISEAKREIRNNKR